MGTDDSHRITRTTFFMKKIWLYFMLAMLIILIFGCDSSETVIPKEVGKPTELTLAHAFPESSIWGMTYKYWADRVYEKSNGQLKITIYPTASLIALDESYEAVSQGTVDMSSLPSSYFSGKAPELTILDLSGSYPPKRWLEVDETIAPILDEILYDHNVKYLFPVYMGEMLAFVNDKVGKPIQTVDDWKNLKIRDMGKWSGRAIEAWGGVPLTLPLGELPVALERGTVDGVHVSWIVGYSYRLYEMAPYITYTGFSPLWEFLGINLKVWNSLKEDEKNIMIEAGKDAAKYCDNISKELWEGFVNAVEETGNTINYLTESEKNKHIESLDPLIEEIKKISNPKGIELIDALATFKE